MGRGGKSSRTGRTGLRALIDTSALLALTDPRDQNHGRAVEIGPPFVESGGLFVSTWLVLAEFHGRALHLRGPEHARRLVRGVLEDPAYQWRDVSAEWIPGAFSGWLERFADQDFSLTDAVSFELMRRERLSHAFAFDHHFVIAGFQLLA